jgi:hypothetical protein
MYTITLANNKKIENLEKNLDVYVSKTEIDESIFENNLKTMKVSDGTNEEVFHDIIFVRQMKANENEFFLMFREKTEQEKLDETITDIQTAVAEVYETITGGTNG